MRYVRALSSVEESALERLHREGISHRERQRAHAVLLSSRNYGREVIADISGVSRHTVSLWLDRFERDGVSGLRDAPKSDRPPKSGRPPKMTKEAQQILREALQNPIPGLKPLLLERLKKGE